jgi:2-iminoacetate synthase
MAPNLDSKGGLSALFRPVSEEIFPVPDFAELRDLVYRPNHLAVTEVLNRERLSINDLAVLLSPDAAAFLPTLAARAAELTNRRFGRTIQIYAPLYLSSFCGNRCQYCGFSAENQITRRVLTMAEAEAEAAILAARGFSHILLVSGEAPARLGVDYLVELAERLRPRFASLSIEVQPLSEEEYRRLYRAGIVAVAVYQETYDAAVYPLVHLAGPKTDMLNRLAAPARVAAAGMREVGIGALLGLSDWRLEGLALGMHLAWLRRRFWRTGLTVSFPRLRPAAGGFAPLVEVGERELVQLLLALRIFDPDVGLVLSTREEARFRDGMIGLGPTRYSAGSCTAPGGYSDPGQAAEQFEIGDQRTVEEVCQAIRAKGHDPVLKDWDVTFQVETGGAQFHPEAECPG